MALIARADGRKQASGSPAIPSEKNRIADWLRLLVAPEGCVELRSIGVTRHGFRSTHAESTFYAPEELDTMARDALQMTRRAQGVYWTLNPIHAGLYHSPAEKSANDRDALARRWLLIDIDPRRPANVSATDAEKAAAWQSTLIVRDYLRSQAWPDPILADSGNGYHLLYRIDLPNDNASRDLIRAVLRTLAVRFDTPEASVDTSVYNASRICKLYGTTARKGEPTDDRPHRPSKIVEVPASLDTVGLEWLEALVREPATNGHAANGHTANGHTNGTPPKPKGLIARAGLSSDPKRAHALTALKAETDKLATTPAGDRNNQLFKSAAALAELVAAGTLDQHEVNAALAAAAAQAGLEHDEIHKTLTNGVKRGSTHPRDLNHVGNRNGHGHAVKEADAVPLDAPWVSPALEPALPAEPFPLEVFPPEIARFIREGAACLSCAPDFLGLAVLTIAGAAIGRSVVLAVKDSWIEAASIYGAVVAPPGATKSPALSLVSRPLWAITEELIRGHKEEVVRIHEDDPKASAPPLKRIAVNDATCESLAPILQDNPRGVVMVRDELTAWVAGLNQYKSGGKGADRQFFLSAWSGAAVTVDRKSQEKGPIHIPHPFLSVLGALTPEMLSELSEVKGRDDGFIDRLLFVYPEPVVVRWRPDGVSDELAAAWSFAVYRLWGREMVYDRDEGRFRPWFVRFTPDALDTYASWFDDHCREAESHDFPPHLVGAWSKLRAYGARLALILEQIRWACDPTAGDGAPDVSRHAAEGSILLTDYFKAHIRRSRSLIRGGLGDNDDARAILGWLQRSQRGSASVRDIRKNFPSRFAGDDKTLTDALAWLEDRHCIRLTPSPRKKMGRPPTPVYAVNPELVPNPKSQEDIENEEPPF